MGSELEVKRERGTFRQGRIELDVPVDWHDGLRVSVVPADERIGVTEAEWPETPAARQAHLAMIDSIEPLELTSREEAEIAAARAAARSVGVEAVRRKLES